MIRASFKRTIDEITKKWKLYTKTRQAFVTPRCTCTCFQHPPSPRRLFSNQVGKGGGGAGGGVEVKDDEQSTEHYLISLGYTDPKIQKGMKNALEAAFGNNLTVANLKSIGNEGMFTCSHVVCFVVCCKTIIIIHGMSMKTCFFSVLLFRNPTQTHHRSFCII